MTAIKRMMVSMVLALVLSLGVLLVTSAIESQPAEAHVKSSFRVYCNHKDRWFWDHWVDVRSHYWDYYGRHYHYGHVWHWGGAYQGSYRNACTH